MRVFIKFCLSHEPENHASNIQDKQKGEERLMEKEPRAQKTELLVMTQYGSLKVERGQSQKLMR